MQHLQRFEKRDKFYVQNKIFETDTEKFYREIQSRTCTIEQTLLEREICIILNDIWGADKCLSENCKWLKVSKNNMGSIQKQQ